VIKMESNSEVRSRTWALHVRALLCPSGNGGGVLGEHGPQPVAIAELESGGVKLEVKS
jgi:hypothetical protein